MSGRVLARRGALGSLVASVALSLVLQVGGCGGLDTVFLGKWQVSLAGAGGLGGGQSGGTAGIDAGGAGGQGGDGGTPRVVGLPSDPELWNGAVRLVAASSRLTVGWDGTSVALAPYGGAADQTWRFEADGQNVRFKHEGTSNCLNGSLAVAACADAPTFAVARLRERSEETPSLYEIENDAGLCVSVSEGLAWGECGQATSGFYFEPVGWGSRAMQTAEHEVHLALIVKALASTGSSAVALGIDADHVAAVSHSIDECLRIWLEAITDGRVTSSATAFSSPRSIEQLGTSCGYSVPAQSELSADFSEYLPAGQFDGAVVYWRPGTGVDGGWSCSGLGGPNGGGLAYQTYGSDAAGWLACDITPSDAFLQAYLAMAAQYYEAKGVPAPEGKLAGNVDAKYAAGPFSWNHFRRDYLLGRVIRSDGTYGGMGPRAFRLGTIRAGAAP